MRKQNSKTETIDELNEKSRRWNILSMLLIAKFRTMVASFETKCVG